MENDIWNRRSLGLLGLEESAKYSALDCSKKKKRSMRLLGLEIAKLPDSLCQ